MSSAALITFSVSRCKLIDKSTSKKSGVTLTSALRNAECNVPSAWAHIITDWMCLMCCLLVTLQTQALQNGCNKDQFEKITKNNDLKNWIEVRLILQEV